MTSRRVLRVITRMNIGGPAIHVSLLSSRLDPTRFSTLLVSGREHPSEGNMLDLGRTDIATRPLIVPTLRRPVAPVADLRTLVRLYSIARSFQPDIVHTHLAKAGFLGRLAGRAAGARVVIHTYHGSIFSEYFGRAESTAYVAIERALARISTRIVAITPLQRGDLIRRRIAPADKIVVIPLGLDLEPFLAGGDRTVARQRLNIPSDAFAVGIVARLVPVKDVATFIHAAASLRERVPHLCALVVGDGDERGALEDLVRRLGLEGRVRFAGWRSDVASVYAALDVVALSSLNEGSPVSAIEAMAAGRPVVSTGVGGVPDVVEHGISGLLVPPRRPDLLAAAMADLASDAALRSRLGTAARSAVHPRFSATRLVSDIQRLYSELLEEAAP